MANEISVTFAANVTKSNLLREFEPGAQRWDMAGDKIYHNTLDIGTSEESVTSFGDVSTEGYCYLRNLDDTNFVQVGFATTDYGIRLEPGEYAWFRLEPSADLFLKADTAACVVEIAVIED